MLNISKHSVATEVRSKHLSTLELVESKQSKKVLLHLSTVGLILLIIIGLLPWTQNIRSTGKVTTIYPDQQPQTVHSVIAGRIEQWYVKDGSYVKKGDTLVRLSEIKLDFFDTELLPRTKKQLELKEQTVSSYIDKVKAIDAQLHFLKDQRSLQLEVAANKVLQSQLAVERDSIDFESKQYAFQTASLQFKRADSLYLSGLVSLTDRENRFVRMQQAKAAEIDAKNDFLKSKNEYLNAVINQSATIAKYDTDLAKLRSEKLSVLGEQFDSEAMVAKLQNEYSNYVYRNNLYYILSPRDGYLNKAIQSGLGETIKEGDPLINIIPSESALAVEVFVKPIDLPLLDTGQHVRLQFDGWPAIIFSGWPNASVGTYGGTIYSVEQYINSNGKCRILIKPDVSTTPWPKVLRFGGGVNSMMLLNDVPIWYELWRKINGFPPDFYVNSEDQNEKK